MRQALRMLLQQSTAWTSQAARTVNVLQCSPVVCSAVGSRQASTSKDRARGSDNSSRSRRRGPAGNQFESDEEELLPHRAAAAARAAARARAEPGILPIPKRPRESPQQDPSPPSATQSQFSGDPASPQRAQQGVGQGAVQEEGGAAVYPTFVPRNPGVTDGPWNPVDIQMVRSAVADADDAVQPSKIDAAGYVLLGKSLAELESLVVQHQQPKYRAKQLLDGVLQNARSIDAIKNIPKEFKAALVAGGVRTGRSVLHKSVGSPDGTRKFLLQLHDGRVVETVGIPNDEDVAEEGGRRRLTVCVSSQVGCPMRCSFCATGKGGFFRNLMPHEILDQVMTVQEEFGQRVSNIVYMGMGEPLLNVPAVVQSAELINQQLGISGRSITISTVGVPNAIKRLAKARLSATLAVSIHAPTQELRESLIPSAKAYPIEALMKDCQAYYKITGRRVTFEYTLLSGVNDGAEQARQLGQLLRSHDLMSHVNLIPWNPVDESEFQRPSRNRVFQFVRELQAAGLTTTVRVTRGLEAAAACGQLRNMYQKEPLPQFAAPT